MMVHICILFGKCKIPNETLGCGRNCVLIWPGRGEVTAATDEVWPAVADNPSESSVEKVCFTGECLDCDMVLRGWLCEKEIAPLTERIFYVFARAPCHCLRNWLMRNQKNLLWLAQTLIEKIQYFICILVIPSSHP